MSEKKIQRIKLRIKGSPVKLDATILEMIATGKKLKVRFDAPLDDLWLYRWTDTLLISRELGDKESPAQFAEGDCLFFEVL